MNPVQRLEVAIRAGRVATSALQLLNARELLQARWIFAQVARDMSNLEVLIHEMDPKPVTP